MTIVNLCWRQNKIDFSSFFDFQKVLKKINFFKKYALFIPLKGKNITRFTDLLIKWDD